MFDGEVKLGARTTQIQIRVAPGMELGGSAQRLAGAHAAGGFAGVVHDEHGELVLMLVLRGAQVGEQRDDFAAGVLVDAIGQHRAWQPPSQQRLQSGPWATFCPFSVRDHCR